MQANPANLRFMIISHSPIDSSNVMLQIDDDIVSKPQSQEKVLGVELDNEFNFNGHVGVSCTKAVIPLDTLAGILDS